MWHDWESLICHVAGCSILRGNKYRQCFNFIFQFFFISRLERSKVRVSFFQSSKPQQVSPPCSESTLLYYGDNFYNNNSLIDSFLHNSALSDTDSRMTAVIPPDYNRQVR